MFAVEWSRGIEDAWSDLASFAPKVIAALVVLVVGWFIARVIRKIVEKVLAKIKFDQYVDKAGIGAPVERAGYPDSGKLLAKLIYYMIMLTVLQLAIGVFGDSAVNEAFDGLIAFIPKLFIALIIVVITGVVANTVRSLVEPAVSHLGAGPLLAKAAFVAIDGDQPERMAGMRRSRGLFHPSRSRLREWLDTGAPEGVGEHVERCEACADRLEEIDRAEAPTDLAGSGPLRAALAELIAPPDDLTDRVLVGLDGRRRAERELALFAGLFTIGIETAQLMIEEPGAPNRNEQPHDERRIVDPQEGPNRE